MVLPSARAARATLALNSGLRAAFLRRAMIPSGIRGPTLTDPAVTPPDPHNNPDCSAPRKWGPLHTIAPELDIARAMMHATGSNSPLTAALSQSLVATLVGGEPCLLQFDHQASP